MVAKRKRRNELTHTRKRQKKSPQEITAAFPPTFYKYVSKEGKEIEGF